MRRSILNELLSARARRQAVALVSTLDGGAQRIVRAEEYADDALHEALDAAFKFDKSGVCSTPSGEVFIQAFNPPLRLVIVGAVHIAQSLARMAGATGYEVLVVDPRSAFATVERFPGVTVHAAWPDEVLSNLRLDPRTAVAALTHDPKIDDPALQLALKSSCFYIGALGSGKTQAARWDRLSAAGCDGAALKRIHGPIGLDIGARGAEEIAIAILAEMTKCLRKPD